MAKMGDRLIHEYFEIHIGVLWEAVTDKERIP